MENKINWKQAIAAAVVGIIAALIWNLWGRRLIGAASGALETTYLPRTGTPGPGGVVPGVEAMLGDTSCGKGCC
jgi:hypothetical protein